MLPNSPLVE